MVDFVFTSIFIVILIRSHTHIQHHHTTPSIKPNAESVNTTRNPRTGILPAVSLLIHRLVKRAAHDDDLGDPGPKTVSCRPSFDDS